MADLDAKGYAGRANNGENARTRTPIPPKTSFEGFAGATPGLFQEIGVPRTTGGRIAVFPHCPKCCSYDLYQQDNIGSYECRTCGLQDIAEQVARRVM